jgi:phytoene synthase
VSEQVFETCEEAVHKADYDRFAAALFAPKNVRPHLLALYAFHYEIAKTAETVSQPLAGQIRLQWWRDAIAELRAGKTRDHPVVQALAEVLRAHDLPEVLFDQMIDAREMDFDETPFHTLASLKAYADATSGNLMRLAARILGAGDDLDRVAREAGIAYAIAGLLRAVPYHAAGRRWMLPTAALRAAGASPESVFAFQASEGLAAVFGEMSAVAHAHLEIARRIQAPRKFLAAFLPAALVPLYLKPLARPAFNPFRDIVDVPIYRRQLAMLRAMMRGRL